jgi:hypothetical protein
VGARVSWRDAQGLQGVVELSYAEIFIGRAPECAIRTDDPMVSRRHARIYFQDGRHVIEDLGSANGIYVADVRAQTHAMQNGDNLRCGSLWLSYQNDGFAVSPQVSFGTPTGNVPPSGATSFGGAISGGPPPPSGAPSPSGHAVDPQAEMMRMQRRIDQLTSEVRLLRGGGDSAMRMEELEEKLSRLERDNGELNEKCTKLEKMAAQGGGGSVSIGTAQLRLGRAEEVVNGLNDVLSELRINILAAEGEVEQWSQSLPRASYDLVYESLRGCRGHMETAKELMRLLRAEAR